MEQTLEQMIMEKFEEILNCKETKAVENAVEKIILAKGTIEGAPIVTGLLMGAVSCLLFKADEATKSFIVKTFDSCLEELEIK